MMTHAQHNDTHTHTHSMMTHTHTHTRLETNTHGMETHKHGMMTHALSRLFSMMPMPLHTRFRLISYVESGCTYRGGGRLRDQEAEWMKPGTQGREGAE